MKKIIILIAASIACVMIFMTSCENSKPALSKVSTDGSTSMEKMMGFLGEGFENENPNISFTYNATGSSAGISGVLEDRCDIGLASRAIKPEEKKKGLIGKTVAYDSIVVVVNRDNPIKNLSMKEIRDIFTGKIKNWKEVGGKNLEIVLIGREAGSGTRDGFESVTGIGEKSKYRQELTSAGDVITTVSGNESSVGYVSLSSVKDSIKMISVDGVKPSEESVRTGKYAVRRPFVFVLRKDKKVSDAAKTFLDFVETKRAQELISRSGQVPLGEKDEQK